MRVFIIIKFYLGEVWVGVLMVKKIVYRVDWCVLLWIFLMMEYWWVELGFFCSRVGGRKY